MWDELPERGLPVNDQYYSPAPDTPSQPVPCTFLFRGRMFTCQTDAGVFSKGALDEGTALLLDNLPALTGHVLDVGCGWGPMGIALKKTYPDCQVTMVDVNQRALGLCRENAARHQAAVRVLESDRYNGLPPQERGTYQAIITNPPIRAGKQVVYRILSEAARWLAPEGVLYLVIRKQQGADSAIKYLKTLYQQVEILDRSHGYRVIAASQPNLCHPDTAESLV